MLEPPIQNWTEQSSIVARLVSVSVCGRRRGIPRPGERYIPVASHGLDGNRWFRVMDLLVGARTWLPRSVSGLYLAVLRSVSMPDVVTSNTFARNCHGNPAISSGCVHGSPVCG
jgi:hypothetical protein